MNLKFHFQSTTPVPLGLRPLEFTSSLLSSSILQHYFLHYHLILHSSSSYTSLHFTTKLLSVFPLFYTRIFPLKTAGRYQSTSIFHLNPLEETKRNAGDSLAHWIWKKKSLRTCTRHGLLAYNKNLMKQQYHIQIFQLNLNIQTLKKQISSLHMWKKKSAEKMYQAWVHSRKCKCSWPELEVEGVLQILQYSTTRWPWPIQTQFTDKQLKRDTQST